MVHVISVVMILHETLTLQWFDPNTRKVVYSPVVILFHPSYSALVTKGGPNKDMHYN